LSKNEASKQRPSTAHSLTLLGRCIVHITQSFLESL
jgi:hypothetical protein